MADVAISFNGDQVLRELAARLDATVEAIQAAIAQALRIAEQQAADIYRMHRANTMRGIDPRVRSRTLATLDVVVTVTGQTVVVTERLPYEPPPARRAAAAEAQRATFNDLAAIVQREIQEALRRLT